MSDVRCYLSGDKTHDRVITAFAEGCGGHLVSLDHYEPSDIAVVFGVFKSKVLASARRGAVIRQQRENNRDVIVLETGYINRGDGQNHHYAAGYNGLNGRADFRNKDSLADRFNLLGVEVQPWRLVGSHILICGQVPWDASVDHINIHTWLDNTVRAIQLHTDRKIVYRPHPLAKLGPVMGCEYSAETLDEDLADCWAVVTFNSNTAVEAAIAGIPVFAFDEGSMATAIANDHLSAIEDPKMPDRTQWLNDLAYCQWTLDEMREGATWRHLSR